MSKASEYADRVRKAEIEPEAFDFRHGDEYGRASVTRGGKFWYAGNGISAEQALRLADWIYDTFGDEPREGTK